MNKKIVTVLCIKCIFITDLQYSAIIKISLQGITNGALVQQNKTERSPAMIF
jgi:hypothetical protein